MPFDATRNPRQIAADVLRNTEKRQGKVSPWNPATGQFCAIGVLGCEMLGMLPEDIARHSCDDERPLTVYNRIGALLGVNPDEIWHRNDGYETFGIQEHTFSEIADWLEGLE